MGTGVGFCSRPSLVSVGRFGLDVAMWSCSSVQSQQDKGQLLMKRLPRIHAQILHAGGYYLLEDSVGVSCCPRVKPNKQLRCGQENHMTHSATVEPCARSRLWRSATSSQTLLSLNKGFLGVSSF